MNKLVIFDLDGVILDSRELHYDALNAALIKVGEQYVISHEEHLSIYDGLNTTKKLKLLSEKKGLPVEFYDQIWKDKQQATFDLIGKCYSNPSVSYICDQLKIRGYKIGRAHV